MSNDVYIIATAVAVLAGPGIAGYVVARSMRRRGGAVSPWAGWAAPTGLAVALLGLAWGLAAHERTHAGTIDDGSTEMAAVAFVSGVVTNAVAGLVLLAIHAVDVRRRRRAIAR